MNALFCERARARIFPPLEKLAEKILPTLTFADQNPKKS